MDRIKITCTDTEVTHEVDVLEKSDKRLKIVIDGTDVVILLYKNDPHDRVYVGNNAGLEFTSTGN